MSVASEQQEVQQNISGQNASEQSVKELSVTRTIKAQQKVLKALEEELVNQELTYKDIAYFTGRSEGSILALFNSNGKTVLRQNRLEEVAAGLGVKLTYYGVPDNDRKDVLKEFWGLHDEPVKVFYPWYAPALGFIIGVAGTLALIYSVAYAYNLLG